VVRLAAREVHLWRASLELAPARLRELEGLLSADERARAGRFRYERDRRHFVAARGALRSILSRYLGIAPSQIQFGYADRGKPMLGGPSGARRLEFNLSHSEGMALYAVASGRRVGVDLEYAERRLDFESIASRYFSPREIALLARLPVAQRAAAFFAFWTRREALLKARGEGLGGSARPAESEGEWTVRNLIPETGYIAAVAVEGGNCRFRKWNWCG